MCSSDLEAPAHAVVLVDDVTRAKRLERQMLLAERLTRPGAEEQKQQTQRSAGDTELITKAERCRLKNVRERLRPILASFEKVAAPGTR